MLLNYLFNFCQQKFLLANDQRLFVHPTFLYKTRTHISQASPLICGRTGGDIKKKIYPDPNKLNPSRWNAREDTFLACQMNVFSFLIQSYMLCAKACSTWILCRNTDRNLALIFHLEQEVGCAQEVFQTTLKFLSSFIVYSLTTCEFFCCFIVLLPEFLSFLAGFLQNHAGGLVVVFRQSIRSDCMVSDDACKNFTWTSALFADDIRLETWMLLVK